MLKARAAATGPGLVRGLARRGACGASRPGVRVAFEGLCEAPDAGADGDWILLTVEDCAEVFMTKCRCDANVRRGGQLPNELLKTSVKRALQT